MVNSLLQSTSAPNNGVRDGRRIIIDWPLLLPFSRQYPLIVSISPEWRIGNAVAYRRHMVRSRLDLYSALHRARGAQGVLPSKWWG